MRRTLGIATVFCMLLGSAAYAGRGRGRGGHGGGGPVVRDHRSSAPVVVRDHRDRSPRGPRGPRGSVRDHHGPRGHVRVSNGRYMFPGGVVRVYRRPAIRTHYYDVHVRPRVIIESYDPVPGYVWVAGSWTWAGREWAWQPGYWAEAEAPVQPVISGGISVSGGISIH